MATKLRCRLGKHKWRTTGRGDALTYVCEVCGKTRDKPPHSGRTESPPPAPPGSGAAWIIAYVLSGRRGEARPAQCRVEARLSHKSRALEKSPTSSRMWCRPTRLCAESTSANALASGRPLENATTNGRGRGLMRQPQAQAAVPETGLAVA